jgi:uncharacterized protein YbjT (DUF2867 family)
VIFVTGATGKVGRSVVSGLVERDAAVRALAHDSNAADLPEDVEVVSGDILKPEEFSAQLDGAEAVFLLWPFFGDDGAAEVVDALAGHAKRIVYLSAEAAGRRPRSFWAQIEHAIEGSASEWTFLRPTGFAANTLMWADQIRESGVVRWPYGQAARSLIHERDIAEVAVHALTEEGHAGARYVLTGPEAITQVEQVQAIGEALDREVRWEELSREDAEAELEGNVPATALDTWAGFVDNPEVVTSTVDDVTGEPARPFAQWARDHAEDFR